MLMEILFTDLIFIFFILGAILFGILLFISDSTSGNGILNMTPATRLKYTQLLEEKATLTSSSELNSPVSS